MKEFTKKLLLITGITFILTGCNKAADDIEVVRVWPGEMGIENAQVALNGPGAGRMAGLVPDIGGIFDDSFNQGAWEGMEALSLSTGANIEYLEPETADEFQEDLQALADNGCELCWGVGYSCADALLEVAKANEDVHFAIVDNAYDEVPDNVTGVVFRAQEPSFLVGYIAGVTTRTQKIGFVGGVSSELLDQFEYGYKAGAMYAASLFSQDMRVEVEYLDSFTDAQKGKEVAEKMYDGGCDVIFHAAGGAGNGVIEAAEAKRRYVIGVDRDQSYLAPRFVLTSALKNVNVAVEKVSTAYFLGEEIGGRNMSFGLTEGAVGIPDKHPNFRDEIYDSVLNLEDKIKSGEIKVPANEEDYKQFLADLEEKK